MSRALALGALVFAFALAACRTPPLAAGLDGAAPTDLASRDLSTSDLSTSDAAACGISCPMGAWCVFINRGDCSTWECTLQSGNCVGEPGCDCVGPSFCDQFAMPNETLMCAPNFAPGAQLTCTSNIQCV